MENIKNLLQKAFLWVVLSSEDPEKLSLTVRGAAASIIPLVVAFGPFFKFHADASALMQWVDIAVEILAKTAALITGAVALCGLIRKSVKTARFGSHV